MNDYQTQVKQTIELLFESAQRASGRVLDAGAVRRVCSYIQNLVRMVEAKEIALIGADNMLAAYVNEYGEDLMNELIKDAEEEIFDAEIIEEGSDHEGFGVDAQTEGDEEE